MTKINLNQTKISFVTHEYGLFKGHGGIASYLFQICNFLSKEFDSIEIYILTSQYDKLNCQNTKNIVILEHKNDPLLVDKLLSEINPDIVETQDYLGLCYYSLLKKSMGISFNNTLFFTNHHTNVREAFEWGSKIDFKNSATELKSLHSKEQVQFNLSDYNISPSNFLSKYVESNYDIKVKTFHLPYFYNLDNISKIKNRLNVINNNKNDFQICLISRFEARKNQIRLINEFQRFLDISKSNSSLILAGNSVDDFDGEDYRFKCFKSIKAKYCNNIKIYDFLDLKSQEKIIAFSDLVIMPSTFENFPVAIIECIKRGTPVIGSKHSGVKDMIGEKTSKYMTFDPFKEGDLSKKIFNFYNFDHDKRKDISDMQLANLNSITNPEKSVINRIKFFSSFNKNKETTQKKDNLVFIDCSPESNSKNSNDFLSSNTTIDDFLSQYALDGELFDFILLNDLSLSDKIKKLLSSNKFDENLKKVNIVFDNNFFFFNKDILFKRKSPIGVMRCNISEIKRFSGKSLLEFIFAEIEKRIVITFPCKIFSKSQFHQTIDFKFLNFNENIDLQKKL